jgi:hypothetical protein
MYQMLTSLSSAVIDDLKHQQCTMPRGAPITFFYCLRDAAGKQRSDPEFIMRSILEQVSWDPELSRIKEPVLEIYNHYLKAYGHHDPPRVPLDYDETVKVLLDIFNQNPTNYIIIDGLDQCEPRTRYEFISTLHYIVEKSSSVIKLFVSTRPETDIINRFGSNLQISVQTENSTDISDYIKVKVSKTAHLTPQTQRLIVDTLIQKAKGMSVLPSSPTAVIVILTLQNQVPLGETSN